jgi:hypothetical protein
LVHSFPGIRYDLRFRREKDIADSALQNKEMTPHVVWHLAAGLGGYCAVTTVESAVDAKP